MTAIAITRTDMTAVELRAAGREKDGCAARRMLALAMVIKGMDRASAATGVRRGCRRSSRRGSRSWSRRGPGPVLNKVVRWRRCDHSRGDALAPLAPDFSFSVLPYGIF
jgi:hypothetical protein